MPPALAIPSLADAAWLNRDETQAVLRALNAAGHEGRVVGGAVRNSLMGLPVSDIDIATPAPPEAVIRAATSAGLHVVPTGLAHGTVTVVAGHVPHEVTTLRHDVETDGRHATVAFTSDWAADAARRDFTINALYCDAGGTVHDPLDGYGDVVARRVRFIGSADLRIAEDYLRILRFFRFHAQYGDGAPDAEGLAACVRGRHGLARLSAERIRAELIKLLCAPGVCGALASMQEHGLLVAILGAAPRRTSLIRLVEIERALGAKPHAMRRLGCVALYTRDDAMRLTDRLRLSNDERTTLAAISGPQAARLHADLSEAKAKALLYRMGTAAWHEALAVRWAWSGADASASDWRTLAALPARWPIPALPLTGGDLVDLGVPPGPRIGVLLRQLEEAWVANEFVDDAPALLALARMVIAAH